MIRIPPFPINPHQTSKIPKTTQTHHLPLTNTHTSQPPKQLSPANPPAKPTTSKANPHRPPRLTKMVTSTHLHRTSLYGRPLNGTAALDH
jgi:hypothetical protein